VDADERAFQVHAQHARTARWALGHCASQPGQRTTDIRDVRRHCGAEQGSGAVAGMLARHGGAGVAAAHDVHASRAVHVQVDEAGQDRQLAVGRAFGDVAYALVKCDAACDPAAGSEDSAA
jgi:hypothetical protein